MKTLVLVSFGSLIGLAWSPGLDPADVSVPCSRTDSTLLSSSSSFAPVRFLGEHAAADVAAYGDLLAVALAPQNPVVQPVAPASALPSQGGTNCSAGTTNNNASCSTDANQTTCSANGDGHNCSAGNNAPGVAKCSAHTGDSGNRCSIHAVTMPTAAPATCGPAAPARASARRSTPASARCSAAAAIPAATAAAARAVRTTPARRSGRAARRRSAPPSRPAASRCARC